MGSVPPGRPAPRWLWSGASSPPGTSRRCASVASPEALEVDEAALGVGADELEAHPVADIQPQGAPFHAPFGGRIQDAGPGAVQVHAGHDSIEDLADPI